MEASSHPNSTIEINDSLAYKNRVNKFTNWMKEADVITIYMQTEYITLGECRSALDLLQKLLKQRRTTLKIHYTNVPSNRKNQNGIVS